MVENAIATAKDSTAVQKPAECAARERRGEGADAGASASAAGRLVVVMTSGCALGCIESNEFE